MQIIKIQQSRARGFTLIEIVVVITLLVVLSALAAPSFGTNIKNNRIVTKTNDVVAALNIARQNAISRGQVVFACQSANTDTDSPTCSSSFEEDWDTGYIVYAAPFGTRITADRVYQEATDTLIKKVYSGKDVGTYIDGFDTSTVGFRSNGLLLDQAGGSLTFLVCDDRAGQTVGNFISVNLSGTISTTGNATCI